MQRECNQDMTKKSQNQKRCDKSHIVLLFRKVQEECAFEAVELGLFLR